MEQLPEYIPAKEQGNIHKIVLYILVAVLVLGGGGYFGYQQYQDKLEEQFNMGQEIGIYQYISQQQQTGVFLYWDNSTGNVTLEQTTIQEICGVSNE